MPKRLRSANALFGTIVDTDYRTTYRSMQTLSASEIKRRGIVAVEELISQGPVHILKNSRTACVAMSERQYVQLTSGANRQKAQASAWDILLAPQAKGRTSRRKADARLKAERDSWNK